MENSLDQASYLVAAMRLLAAAQKCNAHPNILKRLMDRVQEEEKKFDGILSK